MLLINRVTPTCALNEVYFLNGYDVLDSVTKSDTSCVIKGFQA